MYWQGQQQHCQQEQTLDDAFVFYDDFYLQE